MSRLRTVRLSTWIAAGAFLGTVAPGSIAAAQTASPNAHGVALDRFDPAPAGDRLFGVESPFVAGDLTPRAMLLVDYAHNPLVVRRDADNKVVGAVVGSQLMLHVDLSLALFHRINVDLDVPAALYQHGDDPAFPGGALASPSKAQLGDIRLGARVRLFGEYDDPFQVAISGRAWLPTAPTGSYVGDGGVRWLPELVLGGKTDRLVWSFNGGVQLARPEMVADVSQGSMVKAGAGVAVLLGAERQVQIGPEASFWMPTAEVDKRTVGGEVRLGARFRFARDFEIGAAAGPGFGGVGAPDVRVVGMLAYSPPNVADRDHDGIVDALDACPDVRGLPNADPMLNGCPPPPDRDGDGIVDALDACPDVAGVPSADPRKNGCPPVGDRDHDGILDDVDACPDIKGVPSADPRQNGCPPDTDGDGIRDDVDACPTIPGVPSADPKLNGCPPDTDGDGIRDDVDACPLVKGFPNDDPKKNGCPLVVLLESEIQILEQVQFDFDKTTIKPASDRLLDHVAALIKDHPEIELIEVQGHTDNIGTPPRNKILSIGRAEAVRKALMARHIEARRLRAKGYGQGTPIADNATDLGRALNRRVQFIILKKKKVAVLVTK